MSATKINSVASLEKEILRLKFRQKEIEKNLDDNVMGLRKIAGTMALTSIVGSTIGSAFTNSPVNFWANMIMRLLQNDKLQTGVHKLVDGLTEKIGTGINKVAGILHKPKDKTSEGPTPPDSISASL